MEKWCWNFKVLTLSKSFFERGYKIEVWNIKKNIFYIYYYYFIIIIFIFIFNFITKCENSNRIMGNDVKSSFETEKAVCSHKEYMEQKCRF